ncbi:LPS export ABC transporter permease LptF [Salinisphaera hydrothermalis]|uniref:LPS export ABC transporter permease LptF n=1 Tax=Salinisphaera hydrothermalis TaxID=563188 RepID=UPI000A0605AE|nr:LPS export ABC transporter permease LptF [Salinisphaera hydrothermalis]
MPSVIFRHLFGETAKTWLIITAVLVFLTLGIGLSRFIGDAAAGEVPVNTVATLAALSVVSNLDIVMPISVLLAIMLVVGRLCRDNEMAALMAGGVGLGVIYRPFLTLAAMIALFAGTMSIVVAPHAQREMNRLGAQTAANAVQSVTPGRFASFDNGRVSFYAASRDDQKQLHNVFVRVVQPQEGPDRQTIVTAKTARQSINKQHAVTLVLSDGWRYEGVPGQADYRIIHFDKHGVRLSPPSAVKDDDYDAKSTLTLMRSDDGKAISKWQTRISVPLSIFILALIALPIGRVPPRAGRYGRVIVGILFFVVYLNFVRLSGQAIQSGLLPPVIGEWWVHIVVLAIAIVLIARENGWPRRPKRKVAA